MKKEAYNGSIRLRLFKIIFLVVTSISLLGYGVFVFWYLQNQQQRGQRLVENVTSAFSWDMAKLILLNDVKKASELTSKLSSFSPIVSMILYKKNGDAIFKYKRKEAYTKETLHFKVDAKYKGSKLGYVKFEIEKESVWCILKDDFFTLLSIYLLMLVILFLLSNSFAKSFTEPILKLVSFLDTVEHDKLKEKLVIDDDSEYGLLYDEINDMLSRIQKATEEEKIFMAAFETQNGMVVTDANENVLRVNRAFTKITGYTPEEVIGQKPPFLRLNNYDEAYYNSLREALRKYHYWSGEVYSRHKNGKIYPLSVTIQIIFDNDGRVLHYVGSFADLSTEKEIRAKLEYLKNYDSLTGLAKQDLLLETMQDFFDKNKQIGWGSLIAFSVKDLQTLSDVYGYKTIDIMLQEITKRLRDNFDDANLMAKIGIDEFVLWYENIAQSEEDAKLQSRVIVEYLMSVLKQTYTIDGKTIHLLLHAGVEIYNKDIKDAQALFKQANTALSLAKTRDIDFAFFSKDVENDLFSSFNIYAELVEALEKDEFVLYYQTQYNDKEEIVGVEALIRWHHPKRGVVLPNIFIPVAEKTGLIVDIGDVVLQKACEQLVQWRDDHSTYHWRLSVNVSVKQFVQENFVERFKEIVSKFDIRPNRLKVELTETLFIGDKKNIIQKMIELKDLGVCISLDDFGTGYSSLQYLKYLPLDQIKIDQNFVSNMLDDEKDAAIVKTIVDFGKTFGIEVIAEGVETQEQYNYLRNLGCRYFQGFLFSRPIQTL